jgi:antitoxin (DNA-binding transcriptional repressor) of toxin-antitoxin stability system
MQSYTVGVFKRDFSRILDLIAKGESVLVTKGRNHTPVAEFSPVNARKVKRRLGVWGNETKITIADDWKMTEEEFLSGEYSH